MPQIPHRSARAETRRLMWGYTIALLRRVMGALKVGFGRTDDREGFTRRDTPGAQRSPYAPEQFAVFEPMKLRFMTPWK